LVSMTDGQIMLDAALFGEGQRPALDLGLSVSRVGTKVQWPIVKELSGPLRLEYLQFKELQRISKLRSGAQTDEVLDQLKSGEILTYLLRQDKDAPFNLEALVLILYGFHKKYLHKLNMDEVNEFQVKILNFTKETNPEFLKLLRERKKMDEDVEKGLTDILEAYISKILGKRQEGSGNLDEGNEIVSNLGKDVLDEATTKQS
ncbi:hypothetical protein MNBD_BACTEROID05-70, partial [hydrothermal vent metagenome]